MKDTIQAIRERSSTRGYTDQPLSADELNAIIEAALQAPTAANRQEIHFTVIEGTNPVLAQLQQDLTQGRETPHNFYYEAPTVVILSGPEGNPWSGVDAGIAVENMALAAEALGLGSLIIGCIRDVLTGEKRQAYAQALKLPEGCVYQVAIALGHKAVEKTPHEYSRENNVTML